MYDKLNSMQQAVWEILAEDDEFIGLTESEQDAMVDRFIDNQSDWADQMIDYFIDLKREG